MRNNGGGKAPEQVGWPDGAGRSYPKCPGVLEDGSPCLCEVSLYAVVSEGEKTLGPPGATKLPLILELNYETETGAKLVKIAVDMCPQCGMLRGRQVTKQRVRAGVAVKRRGIVLPGEGRMPGQGN